MYFPGIIYESAKVFGTREGTAILGIAGEVGKSESEEQGGTDSRGMLAITPLGIGSGRLLQG